MNVGEFQAFTEMQKPFKKAYKLKIRVRVEDLNHAYEVCEINATTPSIRYFSVQVYTTLNFHLFY